MMFNRVYKSTSNINYKIFYTHKMLSCVDLLHMAVNQIYILKSYQVIQNLEDFKHKSYLKTDSLNFNFFQFFSYFYRIY